MPRDIQDSLPRWARQLGQQRYLSASLILFLLAGPLADGQPGERVGMLAIMTLVLITGPLAVAHRALDGLIALALAVATFSTGLLSGIIDDEKILWVLALASGVAFFGHLALRLNSEFLFSDRSVDTQTIWAAINVYILVGICFALIYTAASVFRPELFVGRVAGAPLEDQLYGFVYFSFVTLTTLGYGDITPNEPFIGTITYLEALFGQLYIAIMIARIVGQHASERIR